MGPPRVSVPLTSPIRLIPLQSSCGKSAAPQLLMARYPKLSKPNCLQQQRLQILSPQLLLGVPGSQSLLLRAGFSERAWEAKLHTCLGVGDISHNTR